MIKLLILSFFFYIIIHINTFYQNSMTYNGWPIRPLSFLQVPTVQAFKVPKKIKEKRKKKTNHFSEKVSSNSPKNQKLKKKPKP